MAELKWEDLDGDKGRLLTGEELMAEYPNSDIEAGVIAAVEVGESAAESVYLTREDARLFMATLSDAV